MSAYARFPTRLLVVAATIVALVALGPSASASSGSESSPLGGDLHVTKECSKYTGLADSYCTVTSSNLEAIAKGSRVVYLQAASATALDSDVVLVVGPGDYALGHVYLPFSTGRGTVTLSGGTGDFTRFQANIVVTRDLAVPKGWFWNGTYSFDSRDDFDGSVSASSQRSEEGREGGDFHVTKECSENTGLADTFCTITASNLSAIKARSRVVYLQAGAADNSLDSDVVLVVGPGNFALGHCSVNAANVGKCTFSGGIGSFTGFHARVHVTCGDPNGVFDWHWDGTYRFSHDD